MQFYYPTKLQPAPQNEFDIGLTPLFPLPGPSIKEARPGTPVSHILLHSLGQTVENIRFLASVLALSIIGPIPPALNRSLLIHAYR